MNNLSEMAFTTGPFFKKRLWDSQWTYEKMNTIEPVRMTKRTCPASKNLPATIPRVNGRVNCRLPIQLYIAGQFSVSWTIKMLGFLRDIAWTVWAQKYTCIIICEGASMSTLSQLEGWIYTLVDSEWINVSASEGYILVKWRTSSQKLSSPCSSEQIQPSRISSALVKMKWGNQQV